MAKIALAEEGNGVRRTVQHTPSKLDFHLLASGDGWSVGDITCHAGPHDHPFEEQHSNFSAALVVHGSFQYRSSPGRELMMPGSLLLGNAGQYFECGHEHGVGDRCISFAYEPEYLYGLASEARVRCARFGALRVPPVRELSGMAARAGAELIASGVYLNGKQTAIWEEIGIELGARALQLAADSSVNPGLPPAAEARVTRIVRRIESDPAAPHELSELAHEARLSRYHFLRVFQQLTGLTPHQYVLRARLRHAATRLLLERERVLDIALDSGFQDVSNFNHAFRAEFGVSPRGYRAGALNSR